MILRHFSSANTLKAEIAYSWSTLISTSPADILSIAYIECCPFSPTILTLFRITPFSRYFVYLSRIELFYIINIISNNVFSKHKCLDIYVCVTTTFSFQSPTIDYPWNLRNFIYIVLLFYQTKFCTNHNILIHTWIIGSDKGCYLMPSKLWVSNDDFYPSLYDLIGVFSYSLTSFIFLMLSNWLHYKLGDKDRLIYLVAYFRCPNS